MTMNALIRSPFSSGVTSIHMDIQSLWLRLQQIWGVLDQHPLLHASIGLLLLLVAALVLGRLVRFLILYAMNMLSGQPALHWINDFLRNKVFHRLAQMTPSLVMQFGLNLVPDLSATGKNVIGNISLAFTVLFMTLAVGALLNALLDIYARTTHARTRSIKGYVQLAKMILYIFAAIIIVATLIDRSPLLLLSGLGAMSAVILLVYKENPKNPEKTENLKTSIWTGSRNYVMTGALAKPLITSLPSLSLTLKT